MPPLMEPGERGQPDGGSPRRRLSPGIRFLRTILPLLALALACPPVSAEIALSGNWTATEACPAVQSIARQTNPGNIRLKPGETYILAAANKTPPTHFRIIVPDAQPRHRWVEADCGDTDGAIAAPVQSQPMIPAYRGTQYVLAVNWQPAFCETAPQARECRDQSPSSFEATHFTLHGLWPQPRDKEYCNVSNRDLWASRDGRWLDLPPLDLTIAQRRDLDLVMPGSRSGLDRHEWIKHGTCYGSDQRDYFADSLDLMLVLNASPVVDLFADSIGKRITLNQLRNAFDAAFGAGAGDRVAMICAEDGNRTIITEIRINLTGDITGPDNFGDLIRAADPAAIGCRSGQVDAVGFTPSR